MNIANKLDKTTSSNLQTLSEHFNALFEADRSRLYAYIYAYVIDKSAADDIFQETSLILWREFHNFELNTNFSKWANGIVFNQVRVYRRNNKKFVLGLSEDLMESITNSISKDTYENEMHLQTTGHNDLVNNPNSLDSRWNALQYCRELLSETDKQLYESFYVKNIKAQELVEKTGRSIYAIRKSVHKLRKKLFDCVDRKKHEGSL
ncbi:sigma-70 family RNA polymerase sigma factor [Paraglaciecola aquimarina]|uniref:Sigma-70 family RNA polymerase sigma factor n=1 Tax=Paraglaciecola algarum TaxID=3050085 RepID=A0ABS9D7C5_9ALTE|nr:sigma-70 family RNA polymerase sigma factor [Paraglaciecola sp. G1-23]MCF2948867.1 sigma-70 family RNA polymerase sigma factor [Paraglaciecola sp. G1-23]